MIFTRVVSDELFERAGAAVPRHAWQRGRSLPHVGMPVDRRRKRLATGVSIGLHILLIWFLVRPPALTNLDPNLKEIGDNAGNGIKGGGGGGTRGTGGVKFIQIAPAAQPVTPPPQEKPVLPPLQPVVQPPKPVIPEPVLPQMELPKLTTTDVKAEIKVESPVIGAGGGVGNDGTKGNGPGSGGGIGSGIGTGTGNGAGPGTGAGTLTYIPCKNIEMLLPPLPVPGNVRGFKLIAKFDVDERGKLLRVDFTPTRSGDYNHKLNDVLKGMKFKAGTTLEGSPIRTSCTMDYIF
jgi:protein TonB